MIAELRRPEGPTIETHDGFNGQRNCSWVRTYDGDDDNGGGVAQHGGQIIYRLTDMQPWFTVYFLALILDIHVMVN